MANLLEYIYEFLDEILYRLAVVENILLYKIDHIITL